MTVLVDWQIRKLCESGMVEPFDPYMLNPSSLDIRVGNSALYESPINKRFEELVGFEKHTIEDPYYMEPNEVLMVAMLETITLPDYIAAELKLKSSRAREGLSHALAGWVDNGFQGVLTLELKNYCRYTHLPIYPGLRVGQIEFHNTATPQTTYRNGRYANHKKVVGSLDKNPNIEVKIAEIENLSVTTEVVEFEIPRLAG